MAKKKAAKKVAKKTAKKGVKNSAAKKAGSKKVAKKTTKKKAAPKRPAKKVVKKSSAKKVKTAKKQSPAKKKVAKKVSKVSTAKKQVKKASPAKSAKKAIAKKTIKTPVKTSGKPGAKKAFKRKTVTQQITSVAQDIFDSVVEKIKSVVAPENNPTGENQENQESNNKNSEDKNEKEPEDSRQGFSEKPFSAHVTSLREGMQAPAFEGRDQNGNMIRNSDFEGKTIILYFYPKDDTPGCTAESCSLRDEYEYLNNNDFAVIGVSADDEFSHKKFAEKFDLPFPLIADTEKKIIFDYDVFGPKQLAGNIFDGIVRTTFVITPDGIIKNIITKVDNENHAKQILELQ